MKIAVYAIAKNEEKFVEKWYQAHKEADYLVVSDTGSTDSTRELCKKFGIMVFDVTVKPFRFDDARNISLSLVPGDADICISMDMDEVLTPGWRKAIEEQWGNSNRGRFFFAWSHLPDGKPAGTFWNEKIHSRNGFRWMHPVHELLVSDRIEERWVNFRGFEGHHWPDVSKPRSHYLDLLQLGIQENPTYARHHRYLGKEWMSKNQPKEAIGSFQRFLELSHPAHIAERYACIRLIAQCYLNQGDLGKAQEWCLRGISEAPKHREPWVEWAFLNNRLKDWPTSYAAAIKALATTEPSNPFICDLECWGSRPHDLAGIAAFRMGLWEIAVAQGEKAVAKSPNDQRLADNLVLYQKTLKAKLCGAVNSSRGLESAIL